VRFSSAFVAVDNQCLLKPGGGTVKCFGVFWSVDTAAAFGRTPGLVPEPLSLSVTKSVKLKAPNNASIISVVTGSESKPSFNSKKRTLAVAASGGPVSGSSLFTAKGKPAVLTTTCTSNGKKFKATESTYGSSYASPVGHQLTGNSIILGKE